jgi:sulfur-oxidizing protein SoxZ
MTVVVGDARIRLPARIQRGETITVHTIVQHPMDTGFFRSADGQPIPAYFIKNVTVTYAERPAAQFTWTSGISRDPVMSFALVADREGPLTVKWVDNTGAVFEQTAQITFSAA